MTALIFPSDLQAVGAHSVEEDLGVFDLSDIVVSRGGRFEYRFFVDRDIKKFSALLAEKMAVRLCIGIEIDPLVVDAENLDQAGFLKELRGAVQSGERHRRVIS